MNIQQLKYFLTLAETLNFTKTAEKYYISQTAISNQIKDLEEQLEVKLFQRDHHKVVLTAAGFSGELRIGYQYGFERTIFPKILQNFKFKYPNVELILSRDEVSNLYDDLVLGKYDLIFNLPLHNKRNDRLNYKVLKDYPLSDFDATRAIIDDFVQSGYMPKMNFRHHSIESILLFVALGKGITIVPEYFH